MTPISDQGKLVAEAKKIGSPRVTVAMSVFNGTPDWLRMAVESILKQTWSDFEFLIVDDGSTELSTISALAEVELLDTRIQVFRRNQAGFAASLNFILEQAKGEFFARMDWDDISLPERFKRQIEFLDSHPEVVAVSSWYNLINEEGKKLKTVRIVMNHDRIIRNLMRRSNPFPHPSSMIRTDVLRTIGGYSEYFGHSEDYELWTRISSLGKLYIIPEVLYEVRLSCISVSHTRVEENQREFWLAWKTWDLKRRGAEDPYKQAAAILHKRWWYYRRYFKAEGLRVQASRMRLMGNKKEARRLLASAWRQTPWNLLYPILWVLTFFRR